MRAFALALCVLGALPALADDTFYGWSRDGSWLVYETSGENDLRELHFCATDKEVKPSWPAALDALDRDDGPLSCVVLLDPNKAPYRWKTMLSLPAPSPRHGALEVLAELNHDGESPGFVVARGAQHQGCYVSGLADDARLQTVWWQSAGRFVAALIDGRFAHCAVTLRGPARPTHRRR